MSEVVYAIRISHLEYSGLKIMDSKIGKSTDIENTLRQYSRGNRDIELFDMWTPNPTLHRRARRPRGRREVRINTS